MFKIWVLLLLPMTLRTATTISGFFVKEPKMDKAKNLGGKKIKKKIFVKNISNFLEEFFFVSKNSNFKKKIIFNFFLNKLVLLHNFLISSSILGSKRGSIKLFSAAFLCHHQIFCFL